MSTASAASSRPPQPQLLQQGAAGGSPAVQSMSPRMPSKSLSSSSVGVGGGGLPMGSSAKLSPLLTPQAERRISLVSLGSTSPIVPASPASSGLSGAGGTSRVPSLRDLRSPLFQSRICGMDRQLVHAVRAAVQGNAFVTPEGRVESSGSGTVTPTPSTPLSPPTPRQSVLGPGQGPAQGQLGQPPPQHQHQQSVGAASSTSSNLLSELARRQSHSSTSSSSASGANSTPSTPRQTTGGGGGGGGGTGPGGIVIAGAMQQEQLLNRQHAFNQLLKNLVSHLPPLPASLLAVPPPNEGAAATTSASSSSPPTLKRVYVGLSAGPSAGKVYFEERLPWPVMFDAGSEGGGGNAGGLGPARQAFAGATTLAKASSGSPLSPTHTKTASGGSPFAPSSSFFSSSSSSSSLTQSSPLPHAHPVDVSPAGVSASQSPPISSSSRPSSAGPGGRPRSRSGSMDSSNSSSSGAEACWPDDSVALSVFLLLDPLDIDSKQITFVSSACRGGVDANALFALLYKKDFSAPNAHPFTQPIPLHTGGSRNIANAQQQQQQQPTAATTISHSTPSPALAATGAATAAVPAAARS